jgi:hypothetical protein
MAALSQEQATHTHPTFALRTHLRWVQARKRWAQADEHG